MLIAIGAYRHLLSAGVLEGIEDAYLDTDPEQAIIVPVTDVACISEDKRLMAICGVDPLDYSTHKVERVMAPFELLESDIDPDDVVGYRPAIAVRDIADRCLMRGVDLWYME